ncbi:hypothetical protein K1T71_004429 [Dendrolimus kikuchii]|uniref:Uncharacterized protein n=1 Tax=Dendrolimus kikuchii TaxID=765133 RepID=A0ACC1D7F1_9NEOP|nr:hypothetical protein K1T71_004429 [Dendrolimus kikuchii]
MSNLEAGCSIVIRLDRSYDATNARNLVGSGAKLNPTYWEGPKKYKNERKLIKAFPS